MKQGRWLCRQCLEELDLKKYGGQTLNKMSGSWKCDCCFKREKASCVRKVSFRYVLAALNSLAQKEFEDLEGK